ncbi:uncharacterized [Tachysurus ichikawai]
MVLAVSSSMQPLHYPDSPRTRDNELSRSLADQTYSQSQNTGTELHSLHISLYKAPPNPLPLLRLLLLARATEGGRDRFAREVFAPSLAGLIESTAISQRLIKSEGSGAAGIT